MRTLAAAAFIFALAACSPPPAEAPADEAPMIEPPPEVTDSGSSDTYEDIMARGEGQWTRRSGNCALTMEFLPATDGTLVRRESRDEDPTSMRFTVEPNGTRVEGANEIRWTAPSGAARFVWQDEYATLLIGERRCEYSRSLVRGPRPTTLP